MKKSRRIFSAMLVVLLLVSMMAVSASASSVTGDTGFIATVTRTNTYNSYTIIGSNRAQHVSGKSEKIYLTNASFTSPYFVPSDFPAKYRSAICQAYEKEGFTYQVTASAKAGEYITVPASRGSGLYAAAFEYVYGSGSWNVKVDGVMINSGSFASAPRSVSIVPYKVG